ncbi:MAG: 5-bromo-4-chloroindolyl phosphate hydrolysis family protein [Coprococcus phoceensis]|jgi:5-bromo-4-chloroindolyl phosphate hydrolysis protein|nr:5-bromo-4-chloroindolyl phosphate hydrolysis family protein [Clostridiales bacterium]MDU7631263.1 5-bromo-4-chloroindolyl phosphate hydrolysis family protein [Lachnospiraceae bacterium]MDU7685912.1 5-bromo-4-chloroindolyl phosphate hydrolysis family protein [Bacillota bacterium]
MIQEGYDGYMYDNDFSNLGRRIQETVQNAVESMNYDRLNQTINQTVNQALDEARVYKEKVRRQYEESQKRQAENLRKQAQTNQQSNVYQANYARPVGKKQINMVLAPKIKKGTGRIVAGTILSIVSIAGMIALLVTKTFLEMIGTASLAEIVLGPGVLLIPFLAGIILSATGNHYRKRYRRAQKYVEILNGRGFCEIKELAEKSNQSETETRKDLRKMIQKRVFREAYMDKQETCLMINRIAYDYYLQAEESLRQREMEEAKRKEQEEKMSPEILEMIRTGDEYIRTIREANDDIPGEVISEKLDRLEQVVRRIFESVKKHPEQKKEMDKFMDYYMPTTLKLVNAYREFDALEVKGENITNAMQEIENTLDTISRAFEKLLDDLFQDAAFDVSTDISVLQMMLAREGYKEKDFK